MKKIIILIPLFNDWKSVSRLLNKIDLEVNNWNSEISILVVNDASTEKRSSIEFNFKKIESVKILNMKKNKVHQRCIAAGLKYICKNEDFDRVIIMDADGEDRPEELNSFLNQINKNPEMTITAYRYKRSESFYFKFFYKIHKILTLIFAGRLIKFGNFTCLYKDHVKQLIKKPHLWNSYSASVIKTINQRTFISSVRGVRLFGSSKMNFFGLIFHSFSIMSVFKNTVIIRSIIFSLIYLSLTFKNFSMAHSIPILFLLIFVLIIIKISKRSNLEEFNKSLDSISSIDILGKINNRQ